MPDFDAPPGFNLSRTAGLDPIGVNRLAAIDPIGANRMSSLDPIGTPRRSGSLAGSPNGLGYLNGTSNCVGVIGSRAVSNGNGTHTPANGNSSPVRYVSIVESDLGRVDDGGGGGEIEISHRFSHGTKLT